MIQVDIISGFLGAGKTTLIKRLAAALAARGERIVIIENEFGEVGIDGRLLALEGLEVLEIANGCLCCTLKGDFARALASISENVCPDRILIEPSGIFIPSDMLDIFLLPDLAEQMQVNAQINVLDSVHYLRQRLRYRSFFENQLRCARTAVMSKTEGLSDETLALLRREIRNINPSLSVFVKPWSAMSDDEFLELVKFEPKSGTSSVKKSRAGASGIAAPNSAQSHRNFSSATFSSETAFTQESLRDKLKALSGSEYGKVLRAKGFVKNAADGTALQFDVVDRTISISVLNETTDSSVYLIGESLDLEALRRLFSG